MIINLEKMNTKNRKYDLEERLVKFGLKVMELVALLPDSIAGRHLAGQILRSGTSPALNYGEAQVAESRKDFIHKMKLCVKELKELHISLRLVQRSDMIESSELTDFCCQECLELIRIFMASIQTAKQNS